MLGLLGWGVFGFVAGKVRIATTSQAIGGTTLRSLPAMISWPPLPVSGRQRAPGDALASSGIEVRQRTECSALFAGVGCIHAQTGRIGFSAAFRQASSASISAATSAFFSAMSVA